MILQHAARDIKTPPSLEVVAEAFPLAGDGLDAVIGKVEAYLLHKGGGVGFPDSLSPAQGLAAASDETGEATGGRIQSNPAQQYFNGHRV